MPQHTPAEAVQYWYDAATERREERDQMRAVVARIRQMVDAWEQRLPETIRTATAVDAIRTALEPAVSSAGRAPATNPTTDELRDQLLHAIDHAYTTGVLGYGTPEELLAAYDAAVLPEPAPTTNHADVLPAWEALYEPGNVSTYLIGYANDQDAATGMAEAWMRSQAEVTGRLEWVDDKQMATGRYDRWFELIERHDDGVDTGPGIIVRRRMADEPDNTQTQAAPVQHAPAEAGCWCGHAADRHWAGATDMTFPDGCHDCPGWNGAHAYGQELPWLPEDDGPAAGARQDETARLERKQPVYLSTPCAVCTHPYNWHAAGVCQAAAGTYRCDCIAFAAGARQDGAES